VYHLIAAEWRKLSSIRTSSGLAVAAVALAGVVTVATVASGARDTGARTLASEAGRRAVLNGAAPAEIVALILGIITVAGERRWGTEVPTFLITPRRTPVIVAKIIVVMVVGGSVGLACCAVTLAVALSVFAGDGVALPVLSSTTLSVLGGVIIASAIYGMIGVGFGALMPNQTLAVSAALIWDILIENAVLILWGGGGRWLPGGAAAALTRASLPYGGHLLAPGVGLGVLLLYAAAFALAGVLRTTRRAVSA
jgi:hypothetical protein